jgi:hypothetical protein
MITIKFLLDELTGQVAENLRALAQLNQLPSEVLTARMRQDSWNIAEIVEHLNTYNQWYLPKSTSALKGTTAEKTTTFTPGWLGNYFVGMMQSNRKKYKAAAAHRPAANLNCREVLATYGQDQLHLLNLLKTARNYNLNKIRIPVSILPLLTLKLGDVFRFLITHQQRHFLQINNLLAAIEAEPAIKTTRT